jgi:hypothetical protein
MNAWKELNEHFFEYIDKINPYVKIDRKTGRFSIDLINPENIGMSPVAYQAMKTLVERANSHLEKKLLRIDAQGELEPTPGANASQLFEISLARR